MPTKTKESEKVVELEKVDKILDKLIAQVKTAMVGIPKSGNLRPKDVTDPEVLKNISLFIIAAVGRAVKKIQEHIDVFENNIDKGNKKIAEFQTKEHQYRVGFKMQKFDIKLEKERIQVIRPKLSRYNQLKSRLEKLKDYHTYLNTQQKLPWLNSWNRRTYLRPFMDLKEAFKDVL